MHNRRFSAFSWAHAGYSLALILSVVLYLPSLNGILVWDDHYLVGGQAIGGGNSLASCFSQSFLSSYYRPLVSASFFVDRCVWGTTPFGYHQTNILLHLLTTAALMKLLYAVFRRPAIAVTAGLLFAVQPVQVSAVAWIGGRTDSLAVLLMSLFAWTLVLAVQRAGRQRNLYLTASLLCYSAAIFAKEQMLAALPLVLLAFWCFGKHDRKRTRRTGWVALVPFTIVSILFVALWLSLGPPRSSAISRTIAEAVAQGGRTTTYFATVLLTPTPQGIHTFSLGGYEKWGMPAILAGFGILAMLAALGWRWRRTERPALWFLCFAVLTLLPVSNFLPLPSLLVAPYRAGVTGLGIAALIGIAIGRFVEASRAQRPSAVIPRSLPAGLYILWCAGLTTWGVKQWRDDLTVFTTIVRYDPYSIIARLNLTSALLSHHHTRPAIVHLETILDQLYGSSAWRSHDTALAAIQEDFRITQRVRDNQGTAVDPAHWLSALFSQLGFARFDTQGARNAISLFETADTLNRDDPLTNLGLGSCFHALGDDMHAIKYLRRAASLDPKQAEPHTRLGMIFAQQGRWGEARSEFKTCQRLQPWVGQACYELANAEAHLGNTDEAIRLLESALRQSPNRDDFRRLLTQLEAKRASRRKQREPGLIGEARTASMP